MATAVQPAMTMAPFNQHPNQCVDPNEFFDFGQMPSPTQPATLKRESSATSTMASPTSTNIDDDLQTPAKPSHEYERFKQQTGLPTGSISGLNAGYNTGFPMFSSTGLDEMAMMGGDSMMDGAWNTGLPMDVGMNMGVDYRQNSFAFNDASDDYVDPSAITQEEVANVRVWPGMHQQQAAMAKAQAQAQQQRAQQLAHQKQQQAMQQQQQQQQNRMPSTSSASRKTSSPLSDAHTEEMITRVVAQIRADSQNASASMQNDNQGLLPHIIRAKKDEEDMDEDERLLASEEGKKLSSKERRQLRNKVSARAFRSRRKEYIGQLEGEIALKTQEATNLRSENSRILQENERYRGLLETLLRHPAFTPFINDISANPAALDISQLQEKASQSVPAPQQPQQQQQAPVQPQPQPIQEDAKPEFMNFDASQLQIPQQQTQVAPAQQQQQQQGNQRIGLAMVPENDFSKLNINGLQQPMNFNYQSVNAFPITNMPMGPDPADLLASSSASTAFTNDSLDMDVLLARLDNSARKITV